MEISAKEIKLSGSVLYIPIYSMRDKKTGQYIPSMDGNINSMLHRLYNNRHDVNEVMIAIPNIKKLNIGELEKLRKSIKSIGINNVDYLPLSWLYGSSVGNTRLKALAFEDKFDTEYIEPTVTVCELPMILNLIPRFFIIIIGMLLTTQMIY
ncbi:hypothetical protein [Tenacibaculum phage PTm5]|uniref:Uncharacterized protein n=1 Tax=Tenacibaculum phage PTm5 TaxID=2547426 RepID=A0A5S9C1F7_9CAUD|nr:hypothetical protein [Tenacibaculum phage PTm5]